MAFDIPAEELVATRLRQIHLDFHTSPEIPDVGSEFDAEEFAQTLVEARVNWITLFGKCHHGMSYYPTKVGVRHPSLKFDLLGEQIEACKKHGIATPVYISVRVDQHIGITRADLLVRLEDGRIWGPNAHQASWYQVCLGNKEYIDYVAAQTEEILKGYEADGIFYDMCYLPPDPGCFCEKCLARLERSGHSRFDAEAHRAQEFAITREYTTRLAKLCKDLRPNATIFFNARITPNVHRELDILTHFEIESLSTGGWGYLHFPAWSRLVRTYPRPLQGMTARFHKSWADFGGLKTVPQLEYEAGTILAAGGSVNIGDQLHPRGRLDKGAYAIIGEIYKKVEALEPYCIGAKPLADIGVLLLPDAVDGPDAGELRMNSSYEGAAAMLMALKQQWNGETPDRDNLKQYKLLILPDRGQLDEGLKRRLEGYLDAGGAVLFSHEATLQEGSFTLPKAPVRYLAPCPYTPSYMHLGDELGAGLPATELVNYRAGSYVTALEGASCLGEVWQPYFNRAPGHFSSHAQTPVDRPTGHPVGVLSADNRIGYLYAAVFQGYREDAFFVYKEMVARLLERLLPEPLVRPGQNIPSSMEIAVLKQEAQRRFVVHLVPFQPQRRTANNEYIEATVPLYEVSFALRTEVAPSRVYVAPSGQELAFRQEGHYCEVLVPKVGSYEVICYDMK
ncbi:alpha-L-fucosidase [Chthonomonas calidirosea]|uniref:Alpha-L-fucosidase n=1 Tax=Chthonomonas calidirosea (strain DSM 23976 / ICMP 18418 / T49) TaxID=1303518 RepID=S0EVP1_CHTCT|nr:alpha-amylase family protein [Chthonomonas calidirosea]CCW34437.1 Alpha-L-fucosidase [Chthonomonas calidirosea T49]CEK14776.1 alpha-L-fucosidase [Chthonomonas calidirosea]